MDSNFHPETRPAAMVIPRIDFEGRSGGPAQRATPSTALKAGLINENIGTVAYGSTTLTPGRAEIILPPSPFPMPQRDGQRNMANDNIEHSPFLTGPLFGNFTNRSVDDAVEYELSNDLGFTQSTFPFEAVQGEIFGNTMAYEGHNSVRGHTRDSACNSETNVTLFQSYTSRSYFNIPTAGLHSTLGTNLSAVVPSSTPTTPKEVWQDDKPGHDPPHHFEEGNVPVALFTGSSVTQAVHPRFFQEPTNSNLSTVSFDNSHAVWTRSRHPNGPSYQLDEMPGIEQTLLATGSNSLYAQYPHRYYNNANIPVFQLNSREGGISIEDHGLPQRIPAVLAPNHQLQLRLEEFMMAHRPFLSTVPSSHPDHMARLRGEFEDYLKLHGIVCSQAEVERIFAQFKPTIGSPASRIERNSKMTRGQTPKAYCPFQFCGSPFTRLSNLRYHLSAHFGLTPNECLNCGKSFSGSSIKRHKDTCKGSEWSGKK